MDPIKNILHLKLFSCLYQHSINRWRKFTVCFFVCPPVKLQAPVLAMKHMKKLTYQHIICLSWIFVLCISSSILYVLIVSLGLVLRDESEGRGIQSHSSAVLESSTATMFSSPYHSLLTRFRSSEQLDHWSSEPGDHSLPVSAWENKGEAVKTCPMQMIIHILCDKVWWTIWFLFRVHAHFTTYVPWTLRPAAWSAPPLRVLPAGRHIQ
jgi:hypothetical protein